MCPSLERLVSWTRLANVDTIPSKEGAAARVERFAFFVTVDLGFVLRLYLVNQFPFGPL